MSFQMSDSALLFIWCTVSKRHREAVAEWIGAWGLELVAEWTWLKVTRSGEPVVAMDKTHKQPFEFLYVARTQGFKLPGMFANPNLTLRYLISLRVGGNSGKHGWFLCKGPYIKDVRTERGGGG